MSAGITTTPEGDLLANIHELEWLDVGGGTQFKILRLCEKTGQWALYVHMEPGARFQAHRHEGVSIFQKILSFAFVHREKKPHAVVLHHLGYRYLRYVVDRPPKMWPLRPPARVHVYQ